MSPQKSKNHLLFIDSLRALAAIYVVIYHAILQYYPSSIGGLSFVKKQSLGFFNNGHYAVDLFIVLSGFSLMLQVIKNNYTLKGGILIFLKRRFIRIIPPYYFAMLLSLILIWFLIGNKTGTHWDESIPVTYVDIIQHVLLIHDFFISGCYNINHVFWSIAVEFRVYLFFPLLVLIWRKSGPFVTLLIALLISIIGSIILLGLNHFYTNIALTISGVSPFIILFTLGMFAADVSFSESKTASLLRGWYNRLSPRLVIALVVVFLLLIFGFKHTSKPVINFENKLDVLYYAMDVLIGVFTAIILVICAIYSNTHATMFWLGRLLFWRPLVFIGTISYSLYLIHAPLLQVLSQYVLAPLNIDPYIKTWLLIILGMPLIILVSYLYFLLFERPFLIWGKKTNEKIASAAVSNPAP